MQIRVNKAKQLKIRKQMSLALKDYLFHV